MISQLWNWLKDNDAPNWLAIFFSLMAWPAIPGILYWLNNRTRQSVPYLNVSFQPGATTTVNGQDHPALNITFTNQTGQTVYLSRVRLRGCQQRFQSPLPAITASGWHELKFASSKTVPSKTAPDGAQILQLNDFECILQTTQGAFTNIAVSRIDNAFLSYRPWWLRRWLWCPQIF
jgi:hypothetical protein